MPAQSSMVFCISLRSTAIFSLPLPAVLPRKFSSSRLRSSRICAVTAGPGPFCPTACAAAALPARAPKTRHSVSEFDPRRFAPLMLTHAASPAE